MTLTEHIATFLRDSQYRIGEMTRELDGMASSNSDEFKDLWDLRNDLCQFVFVLYNARYSFQDLAYRFTDEEETGWTDDEIIAEIEYMRWICGINDIPYVTFAAYYPFLVNNIVGSGGTSIGIPEGGLGQYLVFGLNNTLQAENFPDRCGVSPGENINDYFAGRL